MSRSTGIVSIRPQLNLDSQPNQSTAEAFQNQTLRPILKLQNELLLHRFAVDIFTIKSGFTKAENNRKQDYIEQRLKTDKKLQKEMIGMVAGLFTIEEYEQYWTEKSELNRRILTMLSKRIYDGLKAPEPQVF